MEAAAKYKDLPASAGTELLKAAMPSPQHQCHIVFEKVIAAHHDDFMLADLGLLGCKELTAQQKAIILEQHSVSINTSAAIDVFM